MSVRWFALTAMAASLSLAAGATAFGAAAGQDQWKLEITPYVWAAGIDADVTVHGKEFKIDQKFKDLIEHVDAAASLLVVAEKNNWQTYAQGDYVSLHAHDNRDAISGTIDANTAILTGGFGYESHDIGDLLKWGSRTWILGPLVGTALSLPIFDGGARSAGVKQARAAYEENVANYRESVLVAFREVEDNLSELRLLADQSKAQDDAVRASSRAAQLSRTRYNAGSVNYLDVIDAERNMLSAQRIGVQLAGSRVNATVGLIKALGGGWGDVPPEQAQPATVAQQ